MQPVAQIKLTRESWEYDRRKPLGPPGGFGDVFLGRGPLGNEPGEVAVKRLRLDAAELAQREMEMAGELLDKEYSHVIPVLDAGRDVYSNRYFVVMPVAEKSLKQEIEERGALRESEAVETLLSIAMGLQDLEAIVHRDLKPGNVLFHKGQWKLSDFGIARFSEKPTSIHTLKAFRSREYAAPEQWSNEHATHATDIYALGCIAHTLLSGSPPFPGPLDEDYQSQHLNHLPPELPAMSARLRALGSSMLRKQQAARPSLARVIERLQEVHKESDSGSGTSPLAAAAAHVAQEQARAEAEAESTRRVEMGRRALAGEAVQILNQLMSQLWERILSEAQSAQQVSSQKIALGRGLLEWIERWGYIPAGAFEHSHWDVVGGASIVLVQQEGRHGYPGRSASLWYVKRPGEEDYRWIEVQYMMNMQAEPSLTPFAIRSIVDADLAASGMTHAYQFAGQPVTVDDEGAEDFFRRWMDRLAKASHGELERPSRLPE